MLGSLSSAKIEDLLRTEGVVRLGCHENRVLCRASLTPLIVKGEAGRLTPPPFARKSIQRVEQTLIRHGCALVVFGSKSKIVDRNDADGPPQESLRKQTSPQTS